MDNYNFDDIQLIIRLLKDEGLSQEAHNVENVSYGAATGSELVMGIRFYLHKVDQSKLSDTTRHRLMVSVL